MSDYPFDLNGKGYDCAIRMGELQDSSLIARKIGYFNNVLCASPDYLRRHGAPRSIEDLKQHRCDQLRLSEHGSPCQWQFDTPGGRVGLDIDAHMLINDGESVIQAAVAGLGITQIAHCLAASALAKGHTGNRDDRYDFHRQAGVDRLSAEAASVRARAGVHRMGARVVPAHQRAAVPDHCKDHAAKPNAARNGSLPWPRRTPAVAYCGRTRCLMSRLAAATARPRRRRCGRSRTG